MDFLLWVLRIIRWKINIAFNQKRRFTFHFLSHQPWLGLMWPRVLWLAYVLCLGSLNIIRIRSSSNLWINISKCCAQRSKKLPPALAVGLELVFGPPNPIKGELTVGQADTSNGEMSSLQFSFISFCPNVDVSVTSRSVSWWLWLSHLKNYQE